MAGGCSWSSVRGGCWETRLRPRREPVRLSCWGRWTRVTDAKVVTWNTSRTLFSEYLEVHSAYATAPICLAKLVPWRWEERNTSKHIHSCFKGFLRISNIQKCHQNWSYKVFRQQQCCYPFVIFICALLGFVHTFISTTLLLVQHRGPSLETLFVGLLKTKVNNHQPITSFVKSSASNFLGYKLCEEVQRSLKAALLLVQDTTLCLWNVMCHDNGHLYFILISQWRMLLPDAAAASFDVRVWTQP